MKICAFIVILTLTLSACQASNPLPTPTVTFTITPTPFPTPTPEPTAIPETPEQRMVRLAEAAVQNNWNPNDETTWGQLQGLSAEDAAFLAQMQAINADPNTKTKEQLVSYDAFLTLMRKEQLARDLYSPDAAIAANTNSALDKFLASGFVTSVPTQEQVALMKVNQTDFAAWLDTLTPDQISSLEMLWAIENKTAFMPSHEEQKNWVRNYSANVANGNILGPNEWENGLPKYGWYGIALNDYHASLNYPITVYGEELTWKGDLEGNLHMGDFGSILRLPYGRNGILVLIKGHDGAVHKIPFVVPLAGDEENTPYYVYPVDGSRFDPNIPVWARQYTGPGSNVILTLAHLVENLEWPPRMIWFTGPNLHYTNNSGTSVFSILFDKKTNLPVLGLSDADANFQERAGVEIAGPANPWP